MSRYPNSQQNSFWKRIASTRYLQSLKQPVLLFGMRILKVTSFARNFTNPDISSSRAEESEASIAQQISSSTTLSTGENNIEYLLKSKKSYLQVPSINIPVTILTYESDSDSDSLVGIHFV